MSSTTETSSASSRVSQEKVDPPIVEIANRELTDAQWVTWRLHIAGESQRGIGYRFDLAGPTVTDQSDSAYRLLRANGVVFGPDGQLDLPAEGRARG
jgi:hypothetical protein